MHIIIRIKHDICVAVCNMCHGEKSQEMEKIF